MYYQFTDVKKEIDFSEIDETKITAGYITAEELKNCYEHFGFSPATYQACLEENKYFRSVMEVYDHYSFGTIKITDARHIFDEEECVAFYIKRNLILLVDTVNNEESATKANFLKSVDRFAPNNVTLEKLIFAFTDSLINEDNKVLEDLEFEISREEELVMNDKVETDFNNNLLRIKKKLLLLRNYYEQLIDIGEALQENENDLFTEDDLRYFKIFTDKADRLCDNVRMLRDNLAQLHDAYQASLDLKLNSTMKMFTVITTIFLPLTLIVGWYGMNFKNMPELEWEYGYPAVIIACAAVVIGCIVLFKRKKLM